MMSVRGYNSCLLSCLTFLLVEGVKERAEFEDSVKTSQRHVEHSSRRRKGPAFLPSEHDELPPGVAFLTLPCSESGAAVSALDFSEPYGTLVSACLEAEDGDCAPRVWDLLSVTEVGRLRGHRGPVRALQVEDHVCLTGGSDGAIRVWDLRRVGENDGDGVSDAGTDAEMVNHSDAGDEEGSSAPDGPCARVLEGHSRAVTSLYFEDNCLVTGASDKTLRQWDLSTGQCVLSMDILWAIAHPPSLESSTYLPGVTTALGSFPVPLPPRSDNSWDMYQDFVGGVQFWGHALVSGSGDGVVRMWDSKLWSLSSILHTHR